MRALSGALTLLLGCGLGCGSTERGPGEPVASVLRFLPEDPEALLTAADLYREETVFTWELATPEALAGWRLVRFEGEPLFTRRAVQLESSSPWARLERRVDLDASDIHAIRLRVGGVRAAPIRVDWSGPGEEPARERSLELTHQDARNPVASRPFYEFPVASHPAWRGPLERIGFVVSPVPGKRVRLESVEGVRYVADPEVLRAAAARPWKVELGREYRSALLGPPGTVVERTLEVPAGAELRLAYGVWPLVGSDAGEAAFRVETGEGEVLFETRAGPGPWREARIDLGGLAGRHAGLRLVSEGPSDVVRGLPVWGHPEVVATAAGTPPPNVILVSLDTLRADRLSLYGHERTTSPHLDAWARQQAVTFETVVAPGPWTLPSHASLFSGIDAVHHDANYGFAPGELRMLAEILRDAGYETLAVTGGGYLSPQYGFAQGFDRYRYWAGAPARELADGMQRVLAWLEDPPERPFFLFFHTYEIHGPFRAREPWAARFEQGLRPLQTRELERITVPEEGYVTWKKILWRDPASGRWTPLPPGHEPRISRLYDSGIAYTDEWLGRLFARLAETGLEADTLVVVTSDHGELLGEHGLAGHKYLQPENLLVPLVVALPGRLPGGVRVPEQVRSVDVLPTILELLSLPAPEGIDGESLLPLLAGRGGGRPAYSYAASSNYGISLRAGDGSSYVFNNAPWAPVRGEERGDRTLRERVRATLLGRPGLHIRLENAGGAPFEGTLRGPFHSPTRVKSPDLPCDCLTWEGGRRVGFRVPPGAAYHLVPEDVQAHEFEVEGLGAVDLSALEAPRVLRAPGGGSVTVWWQGGIRFKAPPPAGGDPALRRQLEALGYVE